MSQLNLGLASRVSRRSVLQALGAAPWVIPASVMAQDAPSNRHNVGLIGLGSRGFNLLDELLKHSDVQLKAICDVDEHHYRDNAWGKGRAYGRLGAKRHVLQRKEKGVAAKIDSQLLVTDDFREVCRRDDIDVVVVATPDHWHALCTLDALRHGKDVYCEKPVTHTFYEGQAVYREVAKREAVFQTGSQQRSDALFRRAVELVRNQHLGQLKQIRVGLPPGYNSPQGEAIIKEPRRTLDYDRWCGPSPKLPYMRAYHHRWWRGRRAFGGGVLMDWIGHHNDIAHWAMGLDRGGPDRIEAVGWTKPQTPVYDTPHQYNIACRYSNGVQSLISSTNPIGARFIGEDGWVHVRRGKLEASDSRWLRADFNVGDQRVFESPGHMRNFLDCVKSRSACVAPAETAHRSITPGHLAYVSHQLSRALSWDSKGEQCIDDPEANRLLASHHYRSPWSLSR